MSAGDCSGGAVPNPLQRRPPGIAPRPGLELDPALAAELAHRVEDDASTPVDAATEQVDDRNAIGHVAPDVEREHDRRRVDTTAEALGERHPRALDLEAVVLDRGRGVPSEHEQLVEIVDHPPREVGRRESESLWLELPVAFAGTPIAKAPAGMSPTTYEFDATIASAPTRAPA